MPYFDHSGAHIKTTLTRYQQKEDKERREAKIQSFKDKERNFKNKK